MFEIFYYGFPLGILALALIYGLPAWLVYRKRPPVRVIVNCRDPWLYDENHIDRPTYERREKEKE